MDGCNSQDSHTKPSAGVLITTVTAESCSHDVDPPGLSGRVPYEGVAMQDSPWAAHGQEHFWMDYMWKRISQNLITISFWANFYLGCFGLGVVQLK